MCVCVCVCVCWRGNYRIGAWAESKGSEVIAEIEGEGDAAPLQSGFDGVTHAAGSIPAVSLQS